MTNTPMSEREKELVEAVREFRTNTRLELSRSGIPDLTAHINRLMRAIKAYDPKPEKANQDMLPSMLVGKPESVLFEGDKHTWRPWVPGIVGGVIGVRFSRGWTWRVEDGWAYGWGGSEMVHPITEPQKEYLLPEWNDFRGLVVKSGGGWGNNSADNEYIMFRGGGTISKEQFENVRDITSKAPTE